MTRKVRDCDYEGDVVALLQLIHISQAKQLKF